MNRNPSQQSPEHPTDPETRDRACYDRLSAAIAQNRRTYQLRDLGENMQEVSTLIVDHWKPRYLLNHTTRCAYEFMNEQAHLMRVSDADIDWPSLADLSEEYLFRVRTYNALFPTFISRFERGVAWVEWQINPDGRYWMDEDGFGMTPDEEISLYGFIDTACRVVLPFRMIDRSETLQELRTLAEKSVESRKN